MSGRAFPVMATIFLLIGVGILVSLGVWQLKRLAWKETVIAELTEARRHAAEDGPFLTAGDFRKGGAGGRPYLAGRITGRFAQGLPYRVGPRTLDGTPGYHEIRVFELASGGAILVNRGFVPQDGAQAVPPADGLVTVSGMARQPEKPNRFVPANEPGRNIWYSVDIPEMEKKSGLPLPRYVFYVEGAMPGDRAPGDAAYPAPFKGDWLPRNEHRQYAFFWFSMAGIFVAVYLIRFRAFSGFRR